MKQFSMAIKFDEKQTEVSKLLSNLAPEIQQIEVQGGIVQNLYILQANEQAPQTQATIYYQGNSNPDGFAEIQHKQFEGRGRDAIGAYLAANNLLQEWMNVEKPNEVYDIKFDLSVNSDAEDVAVANVFYDA